MTGITINGADSLEENSSAGYTATATFDDGSTQILTDSCIWSQDSTYATIDDNGLLATSIVANDQAATITATYTFGDVTLTATKQITILDTIANNLPPHMPVIASPVYGQTDWDLSALITTEPFSDPNPI